MIEGRIVSLCSGHFAQFKERGIATLTELVAMFHERSGRRSLVPRRADLDRRIFPVRPEGRRRRGRRATDDP